MRVGLDQVELAGARALVGAPCPEPPPREGEERDEDGYADGVVPVPAPTRDAQSAYPLAQGQ